MRQLKERSGLTYRQLEESAAQHGEVLPRSTLADVLRRGSLPRPEVLTAFVRACGEYDRVDAWLAARDRIAAAAPPPTTTAPTGMNGSSPTGATGPGVSTAPVGPAGSAESAGPVGPAGPAAPESGSTDRGGARGRRLRRPWTVAAVGGLVLLVAAGTLAYVLNGSGSSSAAQGPAEGWSRIRPVATPDLCLTEGRARDGSYESAVAVQNPCDKVKHPRTYLERTDDGLYRIQWHHPEFGKGCLTALASGPVQGMFEPRDNCAEATRFHIERAEAPLPDGYRLRLADSDLCVGIANGETGPGTEAIQQECGEQADQQFLVGPA
ncbi:XRE family transcriptional regulator [Streptomyces sp. NPDC058653]|uniref:XRE family transcriptional regulator n=1 Tax=Streptomyces sp. NPDC058653 TaxID=3346576 RepID=UPI00364E2C76